MITNLTLFFERAGEVATYSNVSTRKLVIQLPADMKGTPLDDWYKQRISIYGGEAISILTNDGLITDDMKYFYNNNIVIEYK